MEQLDLLTQVVEILNRLNIPYMVVGSYASGAWGEPRFTYDIDIVVALAASAVGPLIEAFPPSDFYISEDAVRQAIAHRGQFNVIHPSSGWKIDFMIQAAEGWGEQQLSRRKMVELRPGLVAYVGAPEDIILSKMLYYQEGGSEKHLRDIAGILRISGSMVDRDYVAKWAQELGVSEIWRAVLERVGAGK